MTNRSTLYDGFARYASGVTLVTVRDGLEDQFFIAGSVLTASVEPFALALSIGKARWGLTAIQRGDSWAMSILATHQLPLVEQLSSRRSAQERLRALMTAGAERSPEGPLWLPDALASFWCTTQSVTPVAEQCLVVGEVHRGQSRGEGKPLIRWNREFRTSADTA